MVREQADLAAGLVHRQLDQRANRAVVRHGRIVALDRRDIDLASVEHVIAIGRALAVGFARTHTHRQTIHRNPHGLAVDDEIGFGPLPAIEHVHRGAGDQPQFVRLLDELFERQRLQAAGAELAIDPAASSTRTTSDAAWPPPMPWLQIAIAAGHSPCMKTTRAASRVLCVK
jgi:hypothetical protein